MSVTLERPVLPTLKSPPPAPNFPALEGFTEIWVIDFEYGEDQNRLPDVRCLVAWELRTGRRYSLWVDCLLECPKAPFETGANTLFVTFYGLAELSCFYKLGWLNPTNLIDLYAECRCKWNGSQLGGAGLIDCAKRLGVIAPGEVHKDDMRTLARRGGFYSEEEKQNLLVYCGEDVATTAGVLRSLINTGWFGTPQRLNHALLRGEYVIALAGVEHCGVPIDREMLAACRDSWGQSGKP